ncbi:MAG: hypothetical protein HN916_11025, partial [Anaerolineae bacterium]|nr:hypothetical protein [Anaerolineae bacterium]
VTVSDNFGKWTLEYGEGSEPSSWKILVGNSDAQYEDAEKLAEWDVEGFDGIYTLRLTLRGDKGNAIAERIVHVKMDLPVPTPTPTLVPTSTATALPTATATSTALPPTETATPTSTSLPTETSTPSPVPSDTPVPTATVP